MKKYSSALLIAVMVALWILSLPLTANAEPVEITIFHTNDVHGRVLHDAGMGYAMAAGYVDAARSAGKNVLLLEAGDALHGLTLATASQGSSIVTIMNAMGYDAMALGNHDFNYGLDRLRELQQEAEFPMLSCNIYYEDGTLAFTPYVIEELAGKRIGIVGVQTPDMVSSIHPSNLQGLTFEDGVECVGRVVEEIRDQTDAIIVLAHWGQTEHGVSSDVLAQIQGVNLVIDGHSHTVMEGGKVVGDALIVSAGEHLKYLGKVTMVVDDETVTLQAELIPTPEVFPSENIEQAINEIQAMQRTLFEENVGMTTVNLNGERADVRTQETNLGNLIADAARSVTGADVALVNGGSIRATIEAGTITRGDVVNVLPFGNAVIVKRVRGSALRDALEIALSAYPEQSVSFLQVSGITLRFDPANEAGYRIVELLISGNPVEDEREYDVALNAVLAKGEDGYAMFADQPIVYEFGGLDELLIQYLQEQDEVAAEVEGRIIAVQ